MEPLGKLTLKRVFERSVEHFGPRSALSYVDAEPLTFSEFGGKTRALSGFLRSRGIGPGDRVALLSENMPHWAIAYFSVTTTGAVAVPILPDFHANEGGDFAGTMRAPDVATVNPHLTYVDGTDCTTWDLHLRSYSPLIDEGHGGVRFRDVDDTANDMGAYGGPGGGSWDIDMDGASEWWHPGPYDRATDPARGWDCNDGEPMTLPGAGC